MDDCANLCIILHLAGDGLSIVDSRGADDALNAILPLDPLAVDLQMELTHPAATRTTSDPRRSGKFQTRRLNAALIGIIEDAWGHGGNLRFWRDRGRGQ
jgi:hypothetical protein